ncbi:MAG: hypothetical protein ABW146_05725 [Candidatus Sedimenticola sp. 6PFRAG7]
MGLEKLVKKVKACLTKDGKKNKSHCDALSSLLEKLEEKEVKLQKKLAKETDPKKRKHLNLELKIINVQLSKGRKRLDEVK